MKHFAAIRQDFGYAIRSIRRNPGLSVAMILTLALGLGLNVSVYTCLEGILFRARVTQEPETFVHLSPDYSNASTGQRQSSGWFLSTRDYREYASRAHTLRSLTAWATVHASLGNGDAGPQLALLVDRSFFEVYNLSAPLLGRTFSPDECSTPGSAPVVLISEDLWKDQFGSDRGIVGQRVRINRVMFTVVGVLPRGFAGRLRGPGIWMPWTMQSLFYNGADLLQSQSATRWLTAEGRLQPGTTRAEARSELQVIASQLDRLEPGRRTAMSITNGSFGEEPGLRGSLFWIRPLVMGALTLVLLIACTNVVILQLSRAVARRREMGIRLSMGGSTGRLVQMMLSEVLLLAAVAGAIAVYIALQAPRVFVTVFSSSSVPVYQTAPDLHVILYLGAIILASTIMAGLAPARESLRVDLNTVMKTGGARNGGGAPRQRGVLIAVQVAMSLVLLVVAGVFGRAWITGLTSDPGFDARHVIFAALDHSTNAVASLTALPGVESVALGSPLSQEENGPALQTIQVSGDGFRTSAASVSSISTNYFETLGIPLLRGRPAATVNEAVVSNTLAQLLAGTNLEVAGRRITFADGASVEIVGIARDVQSEHPGTPDTPRVYRWTSLSAPSSSTAKPMLIRFHGNSTEIAAQIRNAILRADPDSQVWPRTLREILDERADRLTAIVRLAGTLALLALTLTVIGIYGVIAFAVSRRTKEIGIRMAMGADRPTILRLVLASNGRAIVYGITAGLAVASIAVIALKTVFRGAPLAIRPDDPILFAAIPATMLIIAFTAMMRPALQATQVDPAIALRDE
jgi:predicted permease